MYFVLKILKIVFTLFRSTCFGHHCVHHQEFLSWTCSLWSLSIIRIHVVYKYSYVHFIVTADYLCGKYKPFLTSMFVLCCFVLGCGSVGFVSCIILLITYRLVLGSLCPPVLLCCNCCFFVCLWVSVFATQIICSNYKMYITTYL